MHRVFLRRVTVQRWADAQKKLERVTEIFSVVTIEAARSMPHSSTIFGRALRGSAQLWLSFGRCTDDQKLSKAGLIFARFFTWMATCLLMIR